MRDKHIIELFDLLLDCLDELANDKEGAYQMKRRELVRRLASTGMSDHEEEEYYTKWQHDR